MQVVVQFNLFRMLACFGADGHYYSIVLVCHYRIHLCTEHFKIVVSSMQKNLIEGRESF